MRHNLTRHPRLFFALALLACTSCGTLPSDPLAPAADPAKLEKGLIVIYPGASSVPLEETFWLFALRAAGIQQAVEGLSWGVPFDNTNGAGRAQTAALPEAARLVKYMGDYPGRPVTLIGYSAGALVALDVAESLPADHPVDRVLLVSPDLSPAYDLSDALNRTRLGAVNFWSPVDLQLAALNAGAGTLDGSNGLSAAVLGFDSTDSRLIQIAWSPEMIVLGYFGQHLNYIFAPVWFARYVAPWVSPDVGP